MKKAKSAIWLVVLSVCGWTAMVQSQELKSAAANAPVPAVPAIVAAEGAQIPRLVKFSDTLLDDNGQPRSGVSGITLLL